MKAILMAMVLSLAFTVPQTSHAGDNMRAAWERMQQEREQRRVEQQQGGDSVRSVPELDGGYALAALGLVAGLVLVMRERRKR